jgi:nicotinamide-nucleotide amidase
VGEAITRTPGSSGWFDRGFVTYSNDAKVELLGIDAAALVRDGAVSEETAAAMATGALAHSHADYALAITGIAGPAGGSAGKPVGTVCIAWGRRGAGVAATTLHFPGDRAAVRRASVRMALGGLLQRIADSLPATR